MQRRLVPRTQDQRLACTGIVAHADLRVQVPAGLSGNVPVTAARHRSIALLLRRLDDRDDSARVVPAGSVGGAQSLLEPRLVCGDDQRQYPGGAGGALVLHEPGDDPGGGRCGQRGDHERLQVRPSRARSSWALAGPQEPGR